MDKLKLFDQLKQLRAQAVEVAAGRDGDHRDMVLDARFLVLLLDVALLTFDPNRKEVPRETRN